MVHYFLPDGKLFKITGPVLSAIFMLFNALILIIQLIGASVAVPGASDQEKPKGAGIYVGGIILQEFVLLIFTYFVVKFHHTILALEKSGGLEDSGKDNWRGILYALYLGLTLITVIPVHVSGLQYEELS